MSFCCWILLVPCPYAISLFNWIQAKGGGVYPYLFSLFNWIQAKEGNVKLCFEDVIGELLFYIIIFLLQKIKQMYSSEKVFLHFLPAVEAFMSFFDMVFLFEKVIHEDIVMYHEWFFRSSQFLVWVSLVSLSIFFWTWQLPI